MVNLKKLSFVMILCGIIGINAQITFINQTGSDVTMDFKHSKRKQFKAEDTFTIDYPSRIQTITSNAKVCANSSHLKVLN